MNSNDLSCLGLAPSATFDEAKAAYRKLVRQHHPDQNTSAGAHKKLIEINAAWQRVKSYFELGNPPKAAAQASAKPRANMTYDVKKETRERMHQAVFDKLVEYGFARIDIQSHEIPGLHFASKLKVIDGNLHFYFESKAIVGLNILALIGIVAPEGNIHDLQTKPDVVNIRTCTVPEHGSVKRLHLGQITSPRSAKIEIYAHFNPEGTTYQNGASENMRNHALSLKPKAKIKAALAGVFRRGK